jgi:hypothetical protein
MSADPSGRGEIFFSANFSIDLRSSLGLHANLCHESMMFQVKVLLIEQCIRKATGFPWEFGGRRNHRFETRHMSGKTFCTTTKSAILQHKNLKL